MESDPIDFCFITHQLPKGLLVDEAVLLGKEIEADGLQSSLSNTQVSGDRKE